MIDIISQQKLFITIPHILIYLNEIMPTYHLLKMSSINPKTNLTIQNNSPSTSEKIHTSIILNCQKLTDKKIRIKKRKKKSWILKQFYYWASRICFSKKVSFISWVKVTVQWDILEGILCINVTHNIPDHTATQD